MKPPVAPASASFQVPTTVHQAADPMATGDGHSSKPAAEAH